MEIPKIKIGTLLGGGIAIIITVIISTTIYSSYLSMNAQDIISTSTGRIFDVMTIQRNSEEVINALDDLVVLRQQYEVDDAERRVNELFERAKKMRNLEERRVFDESELVQIEEILKETSDVSKNIFSLKRSLISQGIERGGVYRGDSSQEARDLNDEYSKLRHLKIQMAQVVGDVIDRSDDKFRNAMYLVHGSQIINWVVIGISLILAIIMEVIIVRFAKKVFEVKNEFIHIIAHDLRNPVTAIIGYLDLIQTGKDNSKEELNHNLNSIQVSAFKLKSQINNLLEVGRSETGALTLDLEPVYLHEVLNESMQRAEAIAMVSDMKIKYKENKDLPKVMADKNKITDVVDNLISNALKYNCKKGTVTVLARSNGSRVNISVSDTGYGIPKEDEDKIFKKYSRLDGKSKKKVGTGLGLYTAKMLVEKMGGSIAFTSKDGKGTTFTVSLNIARSE